MKKAVTVAAFALAVSLLPSMGHAATITPVASSGSEHQNPFVSSTLQVYSGIVSGTSKLSYTTDFLEFLLSPPPSSVPTTVTVNILSSLNYPGEKWELCSSLACAVALLSGGPSNVGSTISLPAGDDYWLEFASTSAPKSPGGLSTFSLTVPGSVVTTPLPATWIMMLTSLAGLGFFAYRGRKNWSTAFAAA